MTNENMIKGVIFMNIRKYSIVLVFIMNFFLKPMSNKRTTTLVFEK